MRRICLALGMLVGTAPAAAQSGFDVMAEGALSDFGGKLWSAQAEFDARYRMPLSQTFQFTPRLRGSWSELPGVAGGGYSTLGAGLEAQLADFDFSIGGAGGAATDGRVALPVARIEGAAARKLGPFSVSIGFSSTTFIGSPSSGGSGDPTLGERGDSVIVRRFGEGYTDAAATLGWSSGAFDLSGGVGRRFGREADATPWEVQALWWFSNSVGVIAGVGEYPLDLLTGRPAGRYQTLGFRFALSSEHLIPPAPPPERDEDATRFFQVETLAPGQVMLRMRVAAAHSVALMGDFTGWSAVALRYEGQGVWAASVAMPPGRHEINISVDGGPWEPPPGLPVVEDGFGGETGVFVTGSPYLRP
ncbi:MAG: glycogen-binding domain-containing protein [Gemmatimonadales bacterium]